MSNKVHQTSFMLDQFLSETHSVAERIAGGHAIHPVKAALTNASQSQNIDKAPNTIRKLEDTMRAMTDAKLLRSARKLQGGGSTQPEIAAS